MDRRVVNEAYRMLLTDPETRSELGTALLRRLGLVHDYAATDPYDRGKVFEDVYTAEGARLIHDVRDAEVKAKEIGDRVDAIAAEMDRGWNEASGGHVAAPMNNVMTHPGWVHWQKELRKADRERQRVEREVKKRLAALLRSTARRA